MVTTKPSPVQAILVMDSRKTSHALRSQNFSGAWSQLYKAGDFYLDLSLKPEAAGAILQGHIVADPSLYSHLHGLVLLRKNQANLSAPLGSTGSFRVVLEEPGDYGLEIVLQDQVFRVEKLEIN